MKVKFPIIIVNFKAYKEAVGYNAVKIAKICDRVSKRKRLCIGVAVQPTDVFLVAESVSIPVFSQHVDGVSYGSNTGAVLAESVKGVGAVGTLISHSEKHLELKEIEASVKAAKRAGLFSVVCARDAVEAGKIAKLSPDAIAVEPPELIGGDVSVSKAKPSLISGSVKKVSAVKHIPVLAGAGVKNADDVAMSFELGASGVLVASGVVKADDVEKSLVDLVSGVPR